MIVTLRNIKELGLPLDNTGAILERGSSGKILKQLERKYGYKSSIFCNRDLESGYYAYRNAAYYYISEEDMNKWFVNYEIYVRSSISYKFWICVYKIKKKL